MRRAHLHVSYTRRRFLPKTSFSKALEHRQAMSTSSNVRWLGMTTWQRASTHAKADFVALAACSSRGLEPKKPRKSGTISGRSSVPAAGPATASRHKLGQQKIRSRCAHVKLAPFVDGAPVSGLMQCPVGRQKGLLRRVGLLGPTFFSLAATLE